MSSDNKQQALLKGVVRAVARDGLENTTTRSIGQVAGVKDAYIYRYYNDKDELICRAFYDESKRFAELVIRHIELAKTAPITSYREGLYIVLTPAWEYLLDNPDVCKFCVYYYHSSSFRKFATIKYYQKVKDILDHVISLVPFCIDTGVLLNHLLISLFSFAVQVADGDLPNTQQTTELVFEQMYAVFRRFLVPPDKGGPNLKI